MNPKKYANELVRLHIVGWWRNQDRRVHMQIIGAMVKPIDEDNDPVVKCYVTPFIILAAVMLYVGILISRISRIVFCIPIGLYNWHYDRVVNKYLKRVERHPAYDRELDADLARIIEQAAPQEGGEP